MTDAASILVIIISIVLGIFLILTSVLIVMLIKVTRQIKSVADKAESAAEQFTNVAVNVSKVTTPAFLGKTILSQLKKFKK